MIDFTNPISNPFFTRNEDNSITLNTPIFITCGCGTITARLSSVLQFINMSSRSLNQVKIRQHKICKEWLEQEGLYDKIPLLKQHTFGILISNKKVNGEYKWVDIQSGTTTNVAERFKDILNA